MDNIHVAISTYLHKAQMFEIIQRRLLITTTTVKVLKRNVARTQYVLISCFNDSLS